MDRLGKAIGNQGAGGLASMLAGLGKGGRAEPEPEPAREPRKKREVHPVLELMERVSSAAEVMLDGDFSSEAQVEIHALTAERDAANMSRQHTTQEAGAITGRILDMSQKLGWREPPPADGQGNPLHLALMFLQNTTAEIAKLCEDCPAEDRREAPMHRLKRTVRVGIATDSDEVELMREQLEQIAREAGGHEGETLAVRVRTLRDVLTESQKREKLFEGSVETQKSERHQLERRMANTVGEEKAAAGPAAVERIMRKVAYALDMPSDWKLAELEYRLRVAVQLRSDGLAVYFDSRLGGDLGRAELFDLELEGGEDPTG